MKSMPFWTIIRPINFYWLNKCKPFKFSNYMSSYYYFIKNMLANMNYKGTFKNVKVVDFPPGKPKQIFENTGMYTIRFLYPSWVSKPNLSKIRLLNPTY